MFTIAYLAVRTLFLNDSEANCKASPFCLNASIATSLLDFNLSSINSKASPFCFTAIKAISSFVFILESASLINKPSFANAAFAKSTSAFRILEIYLYAFAVFDIALIELHSYYF
ncbi:hypothetical protein NWE57_00400 [Mycoplasmopsis cynos]|nr:hypothetical protein [Mycoplasmopsis cynos]UWV92589.1 hypothetical protein NWE57_00400 [Mycoplasmopsis cynos]